jgi:preprotein translocase subunit SecB
MQATTTKSRPGTVTDSYDAFLDSLELFVVGIKSCSCALDRPAYTQFRRRCKRPLRRLEIRGKLTRVEDDHFDAEVFYGLKFAQDEQTAPDPSLLIECVFEAHFHTISGKAEKLHAERFANSELAALLLPYARHFVSDITSRMEIGTITLPLRIPS